MDPRSILSALSDFILKSRQPGPSSEEHTVTLTPRKRDLIVTFRAITTLIYILQREPTLVYLGDPLKDHRPAGGTQLVEPDRDGSRAQLAELRILTALAIFLVRRRDVTAVVANDPRVHGSDTLQVIATRPEDLDLALTSGHNVRHHSFFALRNPQPSNPKVAKLSGDGTFGFLDSRCSI